MEDFRKTGIPVKGLTVQKHLMNPDTNILLIDESESEVTYVVIIKK